VQLITKSNRKDDRHDARTLARLARIDPKLLVEYRFGYPPSKVQRGALFLFLILLAPLALLSWLGRKALSADIPDKAVVWFSYMRSLSWILNGSLLFWWAALDYFQVEPILRFLASGTSFDSFLAHPVAAQMIGWVPPSLVWLLCFRLSHPIQQKLRGLSWTKRELTLQSLYTLLAGLFPLAMFLTGINLLTSHSASASVWFLAAFVVRVFAAQALLKLNGMQPHALTSGDLRDRAFAMADQLAVKLQQVYLISSGKGQIANAFASSHDHISFTDFLLQRMSRREVDYVMAHELTHLKLKHPSKLGMARFVAFFLGLILLTALLVFLPGPNFTLVRYLVMFGIMTALPFVISRRFEYAADAGAVTTTGDPRAAISALFKLAQLNMLPFQWSKWSEKWLTHPSSLRRAQAIAEKAGIPFEEIPVIARDGSGEACTYSPQSTAAPKNKLHSTQHKKASIQKLSYMLLAILSFVPSFFALAAQHLPHQHALQLSLFALSIPATFAAVLLLSNYIPCLTRGNLAARLGEKLTAQGIQVNSWAGIYLGSPPLRLHVATNPTPSGTSGIFSSAPIASVTGERKFSSRSVVIKLPTLSSIPACQAFWDPSVSTLLGAR
jgi:Zn-dependent protease with chaperone function